MPLDGSLVEEQTTGTAARVIWRNLGIRTIRHAHPLVWHDATPLMRALRALEARSTTPISHDEQHRVRRAPETTTLTSTRSRCRHDGLPAGD